MSRPLTNISNTGIKITIVIGSMFERMSLGRPCVDISAACEIRLLFSWLYVSPVAILLQKPYSRTTKKAPTVNWVPSKDTARLHPALYFVYPLVIEGHPRRSLSNRLTTWFCVLPKSRGTQVLICRNRVQAPPSTRGVAP